MSAFQGAWAMVDGILTARKQKQQILNQKGIPVSQVRHAIKPGVARAQFAKNTCRKTKDLPAQLKKVLVKQGRITATSRKAKARAGCNGAEGMWGNLNGKLRSRNVKGRKAKDRADQNALAAFFLLNTPGLEALGKTFQKYLEAHSDTHPRNLFGGVRKVVRC